VSSPIKLSTESPDKTIRPSAHLRSGCRETGRRSRHHTKRSSSASCHPRAREALARRSHGSRAGRRRRLANCRSPAWATCRHCFAAQCSAGSWRGPPSPPLSLARARTGRRRCRIFRSPRLARPGGRRGTACMHGRQSARGRVVHHTKSECMRSVTLRLR
jgi:hypothetical protein